MSADRYKEFLISILSRRSVEARWSWRLLERRLNGEWLQLGIYFEEEDAHTAMLARPVGPYDYLVLPYAIQKSPQVVGEPPSTTSTKGRRLGGRPTRVPKPTLRLYPSEPP